ncbi:Dicarboxylic amino acid permease [Rhizoctonia solani]|uniref:Dicarboxylic amino acid permease n=1 Tax=Rhizoctonia solani TaxID=456999 RepID=A0A8H7LMG1_9AGAM|nr:Dicarboxylic amino acid permease [Rhizoctonia solani]
MSFTNRDQKFMDPDEKASRSPSSETRAFEQPAPTFVNDEGLPVDEDKELTLHRGLKARQISMIALGGAVGTGLIIGSGTALRRGGPLGLLLGYSFVGGYATRFVDPALGFALGWNYLMKYLIVTPNNINAAGVVIRYWDVHGKVHIAVWMVILIALSTIFFVNLLGIRVFGELEFWLSSIKVLALIGLILMGIIIDLGGNPRGDRIGFRYWDPDNVANAPMGIYKTTGSKGIFLGFWAVMVNALFAFMGTELIGVTVGEAQNPRKNIPKAIKRTFWRILVFYVGGVFVIGLIVPSTDQSLFVATSAKTGAAASPFVVAANLVHIRVLPHIISACMWVIILVGLAYRFPDAVILIFVMSAANSDLYIGSRTLYALAAEGKAPRIFKIVNRHGTPWPALLFCTAFCSLTFLNVQKSGAQVFTYFVNLVTFFGATTWMCIVYTHIRFMKALEAQGISRDELPYKAPFQPWGAWFSLIVTFIITFFKGFDTLMTPVNIPNFITSYIGAPVFGFMWLASIVTTSTKVIPSREVDLITGKREIDEEEEQYLAQQAALGPLSPDLELAHQALSTSIAYLNIDSLKIFQHSSQTSQLSKTVPMASHSVSRSVTKKVYAAETPEGAGAIVRRSIGSMSLRNLSPFLMLDHFHLTPGSGFPDHPHRGQATVTYMIEGSSQHEDSVGHKGQLGPGDVQWMIAGKGIVHAEMPLFLPDEPNPMGMQLWIDLPKEHKMTAPTYQELSRNEIPTAFPEGPDGPVQVKVISGKSFGVESPVKHLGGCWYMDFQFKASDVTVFQDLPAGWTAFLYILKGSLKVNESENHEQFHTLVLSSEASENGVTITSTSSDTRAVLIAGEPLDQPVFQYGPFVMTTREEVQQTLLDYSTGKNGFENAHIWKSKIGAGLM